MPLGEADAAALFADLYELGEAVVVSLDNRTTHGVLRRGQQTLIDRGQVGWVRTLEYPTAGFPLAVGDQPTIGGAVYVVRDLPPQDDTAVGVAVVEPVP